MLSSATIDAVLVGKSVPFRGSERSAIHKSVVDGRVTVTRLGLQGDEQANPAVHGGPDKAIHHYAFDHYALWRNQAHEHLKLLAPGAFGENVSTLGLTEDNVCIGDRFRLGSALVEVSQPRQPCWKQAHVMDWPTLPKLMTQEAKSGWYYRVIEEGVVAAGDEIALLEQPHPEWSVARVFSLTMHRKVAPDVAALHEIAALSVLEVQWRDMAAALASA